jgi:hypothetical protein
VSLLSHDRYQYDSLILSKQTWLYPRQHLQQLLWCVVSVRLNLPEVEERKLFLWYTSTRRNHKELSLDFLEANMSVPRFHLLMGQSNIVVDFHPGNVEPQLCQWGGAPPRMIMFSLSCCIWGSSHSLNMSRYIIIVTVFSWGGEGYNIHLCTGYSSKYFKFWWIPQILHQFPWVSCVQDTAQMTLNFGESRKYCASSLGFPVYRIQLKWC